MRFRSLLAVLIVVLAIAFLAINWQIFAAATTVNLLLARVSAPMGFVMLVLFGLGVLALSSMQGAWHSTLLMEFRRQGKELQVQRTLAENAEASRFTELGALVRAELAAAEQRTAATLESLRAELRDTEHSLAATLAEMDDRLRGRQQ